MNNYSMGYGGGGENYLLPTGHGGHYSRYPPQQQQQHHHHQHQQNQNQIQIQPPRLGLGLQDGPNLNFNSNNNNNSHSSHALLGLGHGHGQGHGHGHGHGSHPLQDSNGNGRSGQGQGHNSNHNNYSQTHNHNQQGQSHGQHGHGLNINMTQLNNSSNSNSSSNHSLLNGNGNGNGAHNINIMSIDSSSSSSNNPWPLRCNNCPNFAEIFCPRCELVGYCSEAHLLEDELNHKSVCFPEKNFTELSRNPENGEVQSVKSSNNLGCGDSICKIRPLMMIPHDKNLPGPANSSLCLGCCRWFVTGTYKCSVCLWPVCSAQCETNSLHATYECEIFHGANVSCAYFPGIYDVILALRCALLLDNTHPGDDLMRAAFRDWNAWRANPDNDKKILRVPPRLGEVTEKFLLTICHVTLNTMEATAVPEFLREVMAFAYCNGLCQENRVSVYDSNHVRNYHSAKYVFGYKYAYTQHCSPNTSWSINFSPTLREANLHMWAVSTLKIGDKLTASFEQNFIEYGTHERRLLQRHFNSKPCDGCDRCSDPTESQSMASAVRCRKCVTGYLLPLRLLPHHDLDLDSDLDLDLDRDGVTNVEGGDGDRDIDIDPRGGAGLSLSPSPWICSNVDDCAVEVDAKHIFRKLNTIAEEINDARHCVGKLGRIVKKLKSSTLHPHHYLVARAADRICEIGWEQVQGKCFEPLVFYNFKPIISAANICLGFADAVAPGYTKLRAKYIYILQMIHGIMETHNAVYHFGKDEFVEGRLIRLKFDKILLYQKEFARIAQHEKVGSCLRDWLDILDKSKDDLAELLRTTTGKRAFDGFELERLKKAFSYFCPVVYEPNLPPDLHVDVSHILFFIEPTPYRQEYKSFFGF